LEQKTPGKLKRDLETACSRVGRLADLLESSSIDTQWSLGPECKAAAAKLREVLRQNAIPPTYKVAVIGRFKAGKSSFVNELLERRLAGEDTTPETAAITTFQNGEKVSAEIKLIDKAVWKELRALYHQDETDPNAHRYANWIKFSRKSTEPNRDGVTEFDLDAIEASLLGAAGRSQTIELPPSSEATKKQESEFRRKLREYTSSTKPFHCLVESIDIRTPSLLLGEGVTLLDTPGLDDTERFRVQLTERAVDDVDAVLFLTKSGMAYGQSEKDFLLSLLRRGTVKQLIFVVTQVDHTYEQHVKQCQHDDDPPEPIAKRIEAERARVRREIEATLDELEKASGSASIQRYREQLSSVEIAFTSAANHRDWLKGEPVRFPLSSGDPGGMNGVKQTLFSVLATESRFAAAKEKINGETVSILQQLLAAIESRRSAVRSLKDREVAEEKLQTFRGQFESVCARFSSVTRADTDGIQTALSNKTPMEELVANNVVLHAQAVLGDYETDDAGKHWRTRRGGNWGYMHQFQVRVANKIFPAVAQQLTAQTSEFGIFIEKFRAHLKGLSEEADAIKRKLDIEGDFHLNIAGELESFLQSTLTSLQELIAGEETKIVTLLEDFVDAQVEDEISRARQAVAGIWGRGTVAGQTAEVRAFYKTVSKILSNALRAHVLRRFAEFSGNLHQQAAALPDRALSHAAAEIERVSADIRAAAEAALAGQKETFEKLANALAADLTGALEELAQLFDWNVSVRADQIDPPSLDDSGEAPRPIAANDVCLQPASRDHEQIRERAKAYLTRFSLKNSATGWTFEKIFDRQFFKGATSLWLVDPFLAKGHQRRNFSEFVRAVCSSAKLKDIKVHTKLQDNTDQPKLVKFFEAFDGDLYEQAGCRVQVSFFNDLHDRFVILDNGIVFKLGRGLDIYKPASGLASSNASVRKVRECEIDVFAPESA
jgi:hypothetical protein